MTTADDEMPPSEQALMRALAEAIGTERPPADLIARCEGLLGWIDVDAELAELLDQPVHQAAGTRGAAGSATTLEFTVADGSCVIEVTPSREVLRGQLLGGEFSSGAAPQVVVRTATGIVRSSPVDDVGGFEVVDPPSGTIRLEFELSENRRIHSDWFVV